MLYIVILALSFPAGYLLAYMARDELVAGKKWFGLLAITSLIIAIILFFSNSYYKYPSILSLFFFNILCLVAVWKSKDKKWTASDQ